MSFNQLLNQFMGYTAGSQPKVAAEGSGDGVLANISRSIPGGLAGGAAAGGIVALLMSSKSARKYTGKAATYGGAALLGGLAFKAYQNWSQRDSTSPHGEINSPGSRLDSAGDDAQEFHLSAVQGQTQPFEIVLIRGMIAAAKADGHIDAAEQEKIFQSLEQMELSSEHKAMIFDYLRQDISMTELVSGIDSLQMKSELYLASCLVVDPNRAEEQAYLERLREALELPQQLAQQLQAQVNQTWPSAA